MVKHLTAIVVVVLVCAASPQAAVPPRLAFTQAADQEQAARAALSDPQAAADVLKDVRKAVAAYESIVRRHPTSSYSDDALWRGGTLALDAFARFGEAHDRETGLRMLRLLASDYPASKLAKRVPLFLAKQNASKAPPTEPSPPPAALGGVGTMSRTTATATPPVPTAVASPAPVMKPTATMPPASVPAPTSKAATITAIRRAVLPDVVRIVIAVDSEVTFHDERITGPERIFVDMPATRTASTLTDRTLRFDDDSDLVRQVRIGRHPNRTTRIVLEAAGVSSYSVYPLYSPYRLVIDCLRPAPAALRRADVTANPAPLKARTIRFRPQALFAGVKPPVIVRPVELPRNLGSRRITAMWARRLPSVAPLSTALLNSAYVTPLSGRSLIRHADARLPSVTAGASAWIVEALTAPREAPKDVAANAPSLPGPVPLTAAPLPTTSPLPPLSPPASAVGPSTQAVSSASSNPGTASASTTPAAAKPPLSMARQLGLSVSRIVIDPGHGGHDPGAKGKGGVSEAELVLDVSLRLRKLLEKVQGVEVILTREEDEFVALPERTERANREGADLFLSIHANASANDQTHGVETYFLNFATNLGAAAVAARENAASGQTMAALPDFVKAIALNNKLDESRDFATLVQASLVGHLRLTNKTVKSLGVKQAPFVVLIGASMPSVLVEISFVTNPQEAKLLKGGGYRQKIAEALFEAVRKYQSSLTTLRSVANR